GVYNGNTDFPLVIMLHGGSGDKNVIQAFSQLNPVANALGFIAVYPQGYEPVAIGGFSWADGRGTTADNAGIDDVGFILSLINQLKSDYNVDGQRVYIAGFSNGGFMAQTLACEIPEEFAAAAALGSSLGVQQAADCTTDEATPMMYVVGTADPEIPYNGGTMTNPNVEPIIGVEAAVQFWVDKNGCDDTPEITNLPDMVTDDNSTVELLTYDNCDCNSDVHFYKIINGGHTWPGNEIESIEPQLGETNEDINAGFRMLDFFNDHVLCQSLSANEEAFKNEVVIFPNPAHQNVWIETSFPVTKIQLFSLTGKKLAERSGLQQTSLRLDVSHLKTGVYWVKLLRNNRFVLKKLILK
ncbi:MAG: PHB depolymerase family esterase, partial [Psychroflexus sp.]|nr:PHB depolymerase family esterase [Psychroflexus sp.]